MAARASHSVGLMTGSSATALLSQGRAWWPTKTCAAASLPNFASLRSASSLRFRSRIFSCWSCCLLSTFSVPFFFASFLSPPEALLFSPSLL